MGLNIVEKALKLQQNGHYRIGHFILVIFGIEIPKEVVIKKLGGRNSLRLVHRAPGLVLHPKTIIGEGVHIYQGVTIGKKKPWETGDDGGCEVMENAILCAGCKILFGKEKLIVGKGSIIGANSVLYQSTGENEIWAGIPAKLIGKR